MIGTAESVRAARRARAGRVLPQLLRRRQPDARRRRRRRSASACGAASSAGSARCRRAVRRAASPPSRRRPRRARAARIRDVSEAYLAVGFHVPGGAPPRRRRARRRRDPARPERVGAAAAAAARSRPARDLGAYANVHALRDPGLFVLSATARAGDAPQSRRRARRSQRSRSSTSCRRTSSTRRGSPPRAGFVRQLETAQGRARSLGWNATVAGDPQFGHVYLDRIRAVRRHDVAAVVRRYFRARQRERRRDPAGARREARDAFARARREAACASALARRDARRRRRRATRRAAERHGRCSCAAIRRCPIVAMRAVWRGGQRVEDAEHAGASTLLARMITRGCGKLDADGGRRSRSIASAARSAASPAATASASPPSGSRSRGSPGFELFADCVLDPTLPAAELAREKPAAARRSDRAGRQPDAGRVPAVQRGALRRRTRTRATCSAPPTSIGELDRAPSSPRSIASTIRSRRLTLAIVGDVDVDEVIARGHGAVRRAPKRRRPRRPRDRAAALDGRSGRARGLSLPRSRAGAPRGRVSRARRSTRRIGSRSRCSSRSSAARAAGCSPSCATSRRSSIASRRTRSRASIRASSRSTCRARPTSSTPPSPAVRARARARARPTASPPTSSSARSSYLIGSHQIAMQRRSAVANAMAYHEAYGLGWQSWAGYDDAIRAVTPADVAAAAQTRTCAPIARSPRRCARRSRRPARAKRSKLPRRRRSRRRAAKPAPACAAHARGNAHRRSAARRAPLDDSGHGDLEASLVLIFPLLLAYEIGVLFAGRVNGADVVTRALYARARPPRAYLLRPRADRGRASCCGSGAAAGGRTLRLEIVGAGDPRGGDLRAHARRADHARRSIALLGLGAHGRAR